MHLSNSSITGPTDGSADASCDVLRIPLETMVDHCSQHARSSERRAREAPNKIMEEYFGKSSRDARDMVAKNFNTIGKHCSRLDGGALRFLCNGSRDHCQKKSDLVYLTERVRNTELLLCPAYFAQFDYHTTDVCDPRERMSHTSMLIGLTAMSDHVLGFDWGSRNKMESAEAYADFAQYEAEPACVDKKEKVSK